jgi:predicted nucleic acid-binding Zn ribbon protein
MSCTKCNSQEDKLVMASDIAEKKDDVYPTVQCSNCQSPMKKTDTLFGSGFDFKGDWFKTKGKY